MRIRLSLLWSLAFLVGILAFAGSANAQFTGNIEGVITDPSGGTVAGGKVTLVNTATSVSATTTADTSGYYRFLSLAPGDYKIRVEASGFSAAESNVHLEYNQTLNVPMEVKVARPPKRSPSPIRRHWSTLRKPATSRRCKRRS